MPRSAPQLNEDAFAIWQAGLNAVRSEQLVASTVHVVGRILHLGDEQVPLDGVRRILVVGAGKAGAGMAAGLEAALGPELLCSKQVSGWINVPEDCVQSLQAIYLHPGRPAGVNEPTAAGVFGARQIRARLESLSKDDLCIALISGGASALLPDPVAGVSLEEKLALTRFLSSAGANIAELNTVRKSLSGLKGGGMARTCNAGRLFAFIISDVLGDPLDLIGSGPTVSGSSTATEALEVLARFGAPDARIAPSAVEYLKQHRTARTTPPRCEVHNLVIGNNAVAVDAAGIEAERRGYSHAMISATALEGSAESVGEHLTRLTMNMSTTPGPNCLISGGEPTVTLAPSEVRGRGGRNQQLVLAAMIQLNAMAKSDPAVRHRQFLILSAGTDGEDGPTDAAGAFCTTASLERARELGLDLDAELKRNNAYSVFESLGGLIKTGPTHTNVCDLRVVVVDRD